MLYCIINKLSLNVSFITHFFLASLMFRLFFVINFFAVSLFLKIIIERLLKHSFSVFNVFKDLLSFFIAFSFFVSSLRVLFFRKCFLLLLFLLLKYLYLNSRFLRNKIVFKWHFVVLFYWCCCDFDNCKIKHWAYIIYFFDSFHFFFVLLSTFALKLDVLFVRNWCIYVWFLFGLYCIDLFRDFLHNDRISWDFCTFFRCNYIRSN